LVILALNRKIGCPLVDCCNGNRGCRVRTYPRVVSLHENTCKFPKVKNLTVKSYLNILQADKNRFRIFCKSFDESNRIMFLFKLTKDGTSIKIVAQHYANENFFTLTLYDKKNRHFHKISDKTGLKVHDIPSMVFREVGSLVKYKIKISH